MELHISKRLQKRLNAHLPPHTAEEKQQLTDNLIADGIKIKPIIIWNDGEKYIIVDGNTSWPIIQQHNIPYTTHEMHFADYDEAERWALAHAIGTRTHLSAQSIKLLIGTLYNKTKKAAGRPADGDGENVEKFSTLTDEPPKNTAKTIADKAGVTSRTVRNDAKFAEQVEKLHPALRTQIVAGKKITNDQLKRCLALSVDKQMELSRALRTGQANDVKEAFKQCNVTLKPTVKEQVDAALDDETDVVSEEPDAGELVKRHNSQIESFCQRLKKIADEVPRLFWIEHQGRLETFQAKIKNAVETLRSAKSVICPKCDGVGCRNCQKQGYGPKQHIEA